MLIYTLPDGRELRPGEPFTLNGIQYGRRWLERASAETLSALGITVREEEPSPPPEPGPPPVPEAVSMFQARAVLMRHGLYDAVNSTLEAMGGEALLAWEYATEVQRYSPLVNALAEQLNLTPEQIDQLFIEADQITI